MSLIKTREEVDGELYVYGSGEIDQLSPLKEEEKYSDLFDTKIPLKIPLHFISNKEKIYKIQCGQMFTMILSTEGNVYTFGCADNGGIGHEDSIPAKKVNLKFKALGISGGDCHGIAYNEDNLAFWGQFRNSSGGMGEPCLEIKYYSKKDIENEQFKKVISGSNHVIILSTGKNIYSFGNKEFGQRGIAPITDIDHLAINKINEKNIDEIYTGDEHSFLVKNENNIQVLKSWGLNNKGQLGIGPVNEKNIHIFVPTKVKLPNGIKIKKVEGGNATSICLTEDNRVYIWGSNDDNLLGLENKEIVIDTPQELNFFNPSTCPQNEINEIVANYQSFYARNKETNKIYSWGSGDSYILGNKKEKAEKKPYLINSKFFYNLKVNDLDMGCAHVAVVLTKPDKIYNFENEETVTKNNKNGKGIKRKNDEILGEKETNEKEENLKILKKIMIKEEYITLFPNDKPKIKSFLRVKI